MPVHTESNEYNTMKIEQIFFSEMGPVHEKFVFDDEWTETINSRILFSGPNGCGKTIILKSIAALWEATGYWLDNRKALPPKDSRRTWLQRWGGMGMILNDLPHTKSPVGIFFCKYYPLSDLQEKRPDVMWIGESVDSYTKLGTKKTKLFIPDEEWLNNWAEARKKMILTFDKAETANFIYLDAEQRRWVSPKRNLCEILPDDPKLRWLVTYQVNEDWKGQLEASLLNLKTVKLHKYHDVIRDLNDFLAGKEIDPDVNPGENRLQVKIKGKRDQSHSIDDLSAGEHQILIQLYLVSRWLEQGGIVMIDEPDIFLHPSVIPGFLAKLESLVEKRDGQLIITSHNPDIWKRYESNGMRIKLGSDS